MNIQEHLILVKNEDKTEQIEYCCYTEGKWFIKFRGNGTEYSYAYPNVEWCKRQKISLPNQMVVYENNQPLDYVEEVIDFGDYIRIIFRGRRHKLYRNFELMIEENYLVSSARQNDCFSYLQQLSEHMSMNSKEKSFLGEQYKKLKVISPRSVLAAYLEKEIRSREYRQIQTIFPFGFNLSQKEATEKALTNHLSVIEGPPGTGKTQTILNIIANALIHKKTVAVVSNNNSATANVLEKLQKYGLEFIAAYLGNKENKEKFFEEQKNNYPDMQSWVLSASTRKIIRNKLEQSQLTLNEMLESKNKLAKLKYEFTGMRTEKKYFDQYYEENNRRKLESGSFSHFHSDKVIGFLIDYQQKIEKGRISLLHKINYLFTYRIFDFGFYNNSPEMVISFLQNIYYEYKMKELRLKITELSTKLKGYQFDQEMQKYSEDSMRLFKTELAERFGFGGSRKVFCNDVLRKNFDAFIKEYPVILSTTHSLRSCAKENYLFDYVIIDEASQVDLVTGALALACAKNAVVVGDVKQLQNVVKKKIAQTATQTYEKFQLHDAYDYVKHSLLSSIVSLYTDIPKTLLKEHYRCHPQIIGFCNQKFYNNQLVILTKEQEDDKPLVLYKTAKGNHARGNLNQRQIDVVFEEIIPEQKVDINKQSVGIVSPFRDQVKAFQEKIGESKIEADTVHKFQGREKDVVILSTVANEVAIDDFVDNPNLINVAVSRAIDKLMVVVSDGSEDWKGTNIGDLVRYIQYNNFEVIESQIYSVFDLLYKNYSEKLLDTMKNSKNISKYRSENLMNIVIEKVLREEMFLGLDRVVHQPLKMLIKDSSKMNDEECQYAMNSLTHADFVIYKKVDKMPVLVVEVDGYAYHSDNPKQLERDRMKDNILLKYNIPILRIKTNESGEENKLRQRLVEIMGLKKYQL